MSLAPDQFDEFFRFIYGHDPFPWQAGLARQVASAEIGDPCWPEALALPTAAGKTACIDMAVFALACQAGRLPGERTAPRRVFFVVDRRVIVDEAFEHTQKLAGKLQAAKEGILKGVADQLRHLADEECPLACFQLRGGMYRDDAWVRSPLQPTIVTTTVDQFGSRLLFRGYGPSNRMWPVHAGLAANDSLIILDEAHCANPFRQTVEAVRRYRQWTSQTDSLFSTPFHLTLVSATPPSGIQESLTLRAGDDDRNHRVLGPRIRAAKPAKLARPVEVGNLTGDELLGRLAQRIADEAVSLQSGERRAIGIIVNRVATARKVSKILEARGKNGEHQVVLLTGRMRPVDKDDVIKQLAPIKSGSNSRGAALESPLFVVATQTLEVGADMDFDGLVTECASLDALRQRFGRLNRTGRPIQARATVVVRADQSTPRRGADPIYGTALAETWQWLKEHSQNAEIDLGHEELERLLPSDPEERNALLQRLTAPAQDAPVMLPTHMDAWVQTSPVPSASPDVTLFLHGPGWGSPEVQVCWRADLVEGQRDRWIDVLSLCPPASPECMPVPLSAMRRWLAGQDPGGNVSDVEGERDDVEAQESGFVQRAVVCWRGPERGPEYSEVITTSRGLRPGDTVVIPEQLGSWKAFGHIPGGPEGSECVVDLGDHAHLQARAVPLLRINTQTIKAWPDCAAREQILEEFAQAQETPEDPSEVFGLLKDLSDGLEGTDRQYQWLHLAAAALVREWERRGPNRQPRIEVHPEGGLVITSKHRLSQEDYRSLWSDVLPAAQFTSEDDSSSSTIEVPLEDHSLGVERWARRFGLGVGLPEAVIDDLALAAKLHDLGKADPRFQAMLHGGSLWAAEASGVLLGKSGGLPTSRREQQRARRESGYPQGGRHELLSVRLMENAPALLEGAHDLELVLNLVASHHGYCRPFAPVVNDSEPVQVAATIFGSQMSAASDTGLEQLDSGVPERFWRLVRCYGWWGLAWLEALMRLADHRCSEEEQENRQRAES